MADQFLGYPCNFLDLWQMPTGYDLYACYKELFVGRRGVEAEKKFCRGLRKNLSGRWKRLTAKKPEELYTIPPHLRYQLKSLYVY